MRVNQNSLTFWLKARRKEDNKHADFFVKEIAFSYQSMSFLATFGLSSFTISMTPETHKVNNEAVPFPVTVLCRKPQKEMVLA